MSPLKQNSATEATREQQVSARVLLSLSCSCVHCRGRDHDEGRSTLVEEECQDDDPTNSGDWGLRPSAAVSGWPEFLLSSYL